MTIAAILALALAACASPYQHALDSRVLERPEPPMTAADQDALAPYLNSPYFRDRP
ncbi:MAG: hypothetical protein NVV74_11385 [Magnetospirillum sp.]|nr:hypothetical protein [Magnetospirillum sp.]